ncbi:MAG: hypothetical protein A2289_09580 [Deltaproteobacteria bacterium RIFOXYA12_FULL_58_15]|nr:MAG: hypothetical protein A2289_09580 [Deltaproteobacteria bacterium RIFOXYA12_FULL_58_15]OGR09091.1 MAG: hypothetical protein A2341_02135 [Deltaproteobacteria bacterium RIFOXYB12_FULL_58_9]
MIMQKLLAVVFLLGFFASCARDLPGESPPEGALYFPTSVVVDSAHRYAYVVNTNFDLRYNAGWISVVDLEAIVAAANDGAKVTADVIGTKVNVLSLGGNLSLNEAGDIGVLAHRGERSLTLVEINGETIGCGNANATKGLQRVEENTDCDAEHITRLDPETTFDDALTANALNDPFSTVMFTHRPESGDERSLLAVGHLWFGTSGTYVGLYEIDGTEIIALRAIRTETNTGITINAGISSLAVHPDPGGRFLVGVSQYIPTGSGGTDRSSIIDFDVELNLASRENNYLWPVSLSSEVGGVEIGDVVFSPDGTRAFVSNQSGDRGSGSNPDSVVMFDTRLVVVQEPRADGTVFPVSRPLFDVISAIALPGRPTGIHYIPRSEGPDLLAVTTFEDDVIFFLSVYAAELRMAGRIDYRNLPGSEGEAVGLGPYALAHASRSGRELLLVTTFFDHGLSVFDITATESNGFTLLGHIRSDKTPVAEEAR